MKNGNDSSDNSDSASRRRTADLAIFRWLGLLSLRRNRIDSYNRPDSGSNGKNLNQEIEKAERSLDWLPWGVLVFLLGSAILGLSIFYR